MLTNADIQRTLAVTGECRRLAYDMGYRGEENETIVATMGLMHLFHKGYTDRNLYAKAMRDTGFSLWREVMEWRKLDSKYDSLPLAILRLAHLHVGLDNEPTTPANHICQVEQKFGKTSREAQYLRDMERVARAHIARYVAPKR